MGRQEKSILYSHSLNPLWNRSMKWHSPVQKRKVKRTGDERRYSSVYIRRAPTPRSGELERVTVIFHHTVQHENIISITDHRRGSVMWNESHERASLL